MKVKLGDKGKSGEKEEKPSYLHGFLMGDTMSYYVYEHLGDKKAMIHKATCSRCNHGQGASHGKAGTKHGRWHGPFDSVGEAEEKVESTGQFINFCSFCKP